MAIIMPSSSQVSLALICPDFATLLVQQPVRLPALERLVAYSSGVRRSANCSSDLDTWQCELLHALHLGKVAQYPSAPLTWLGGGHAHETGTWLHADPVVQAISAHGLAMTEGAPWTPTSLAEVELLVRNHLAEAHMRWRTSGARAFLQIETQLDVRSTSARHACRGELQEALPTGSDALTVRRTMNELQMLLHDKLNYSAAPNAIWLWGVGAMPQLPAKELPSMWSNDDYTRGIYAVHAASDRCASLANADAVVDHANGERMVVVRGSVVSLEQQWFAPLLRALDTGQLQAVDLYLDGWQINARRSLLRRLFARSRPLPELLR